MKMRNGFWQKEMFGHFCMLPKFYDIEKPNKIFSSSGS